MRQVINITTGPFPGQPGACIAKYNHKYLSHNYTKQNSPQPQPITPYTQQSIYGQYHNGMPTWRPF